MANQIQGVPNLDGANLGGGFNGISVKQPKNSYRDFSDMADRRILVKSWNTIYATGKVNGMDRVITPFRAVNSLGDFLARQNYICGGSNEVNASRPGYGTRIRSALQQCDGTGIPATAGNSKFVCDSSDYTRYKRQRAFNLNYNDNKMGGDESHASYVPVMRVHRY
uniref:Uncharacterized protein n=1 Tax=viral metagenome TaxID=1070528 RepID=A0A6C0I0K6_9ZZZZ